MSVGGMMSEFERAKRRYASGSRTYSPLEAEALRVVESLERDALAAVYAENEEGGKARGVVADVARALGVDIDDGDGHRWDLEHMARVVEGARKLRDARDAWKETAEANDTANAPLRAALRRAQIDLDRAKSEIQTLWRNVELSQTGEVDRAYVSDLEATIVRQANEITELKGERA